MKLGERLKRAGVLDDRTVALVLERQRHTAERFGLKLA